MLWKSIKYIKYLLIIFFLLNFYVKTDDSENYKYFFQLYPSRNQQNPNSLHVYTPNSKFLTYISTESENLKKIEEKEVNDCLYKNLSKVMLYNQTLIVKTCFGPDKIMEIINEKNETFFYKKNNNLNNIQYCYSTAVYNALIKDYVITTYWTENINGKIIHKLKAFNPKSYRFTEEYGLSTILLIDNKPYNYNNNIYPKSCVTFRNIDIYCSFEFDSTDISYSQFFIIEGNDIFLYKKQSVKLVQASAFYRYKMNNFYYKPISIGLELYELYDIYMIQYHYNNETKLVANFYNQKEHRSKLYTKQTGSNFLGINVEDSYIEPSLFNNLVPNMNDLIIIYLLKKKDKYGFFMTRINLINTVSFIDNYFNYSISNYIRYDICPQPKYIQSIFVNSLIDYKEKDKQIISSNLDKKYYTYQRDIASIIACSNPSNGDIYYEAKKIIMPQCINILDEINGLNYHTLKFEQNSVIIDIFNDPIFFSLRDVKIQFIKNSVFDNLLNIELKTLENLDYISIKRGVSIRNVTHIRINLKKYINLAKDNFLSLSYRIMQSSETENSDTCLLYSDICHFNFDLGISIVNCTVKYCIYCENNTNYCQECNKTEIYGLIIDKERNECVCNEKYNFTRYPRDEIKMCVCKSNYSFYKNEFLCKSNEELENGPYVINRTEIKSNIPIYDDCYPLCKKCYRSNSTNDYMYCLECIDYYILTPKNNCIPYQNTSDITDIIDIIDNTYISDPDNPGCFPFDSEDLKKNTLGLNWVTIFFII